MNDGPAQDEDEYDAKGKLRVKGFSGMMMFLDRCMGVAVSAAGRIALTPTGGHQFIVRGYGYPTIDRSTPCATTNHLVVVDALATDLPRMKGNVDAIAEAGARITPLVAYAEHTSSKSARSIMTASMLPYVTGSDVEAVETRISLGERSMRELVRLYTGTAWTHRAAGAIDTAPPKVALALLLGAYAAGWKNLAGAADTDLLRRPDEHLTDATHRAVCRHLGAVARGARSGERREIHLTAMALINDIRDEEYWTAVVAAYATFVSTACSSLEFRDLPAVSPSESPTGLAGHFMAVFGCKAVSVDEERTRSGPRPEGDVSAGRRDQGQAASSTSSSVSRKRRQEPPEVPYVSVTATHVGGVRREDFVRWGSGKSVVHRIIVWVLNADGTTVRGHLSARVTVGCRVSNYVTELVDPRVEGLPHAELRYKEGTPVRVVGDWTADRHADEWYVSALRKVAASKWAVHYRNADGGRTVISVDGVGQPIVFSAIRKGRAPRPKASRRSTTTSATSTAQSTATSWHVTAAVRGTIVKGELVVPPDGGPLTAAALLPAMWTRDGRGVVVRDTRGGVRVLFSVALLISQQSFAATPSWWRDSPWKFIHYADDADRYTDKMSRVYDHTFAHGPRVFGWFDVDRTGLYPAVASAERPFAREFFAGNLDLDALRMIAANDVGPRQHVASSYESEQTWVPSAGHEATAKAFSLRMAGLFAANRIPPAVVNAAGDGDCDECFAQRYNGCCSVGPGTVGAIRRDLRDLARALEPTLEGARAVTKALSGIGLAPDRHDDMGNAWPWDIIGTLCAEVGRPLAAWIYGALYAKAVAETERKLEEVVAAVGAEDRVQGHHLAGVLETIVEIDHDTPRTVGDVITEMTTGYIAKTRQVQFLNAIRTGPKHGVVRQFPMGGGKTTFLIPNLVLNCLLRRDSAGVVVIVPDELVRQTAAAVSRSVGVLDQRITFVFGAEVLLAKDVGSFIRTFTERDNAPYLNRDDASRMPMLPCHPDRVSIISDKALQTLHLSDVLEGGEFRVRACLKRSLVICDEVDTVVDPLTSELNIPDVRSAVQAPPQLGTIAQVYGRMLRGATEEEASDIVNRAVAEKFGKGYGFGTLADTAAGRSNVVMAIPYRGANAPSNGARFSSDQLRTALTTAAYVHGIANRRAFRPVDVEELFDAITAHTSDGNVTGSGVMSRALPHCVKAVHDAITRYGAGESAEDAARAITAALAADEQTWSAEEVGLFAVQCAARIVEKYTRTYRRQFSVGVLEFLTPRTTDRCVMFSGTVNIPDISDADVKTFVAGIGTHVTQPHDDDDQATPTSAGGEDVIPMRKRDVVGDRRTASLVNAVISGYACPRPSPDVAVLRCDTREAGSVELRVLAAMGMVQYAALIDTAGVLRRERPVRYAQLLSRPLPDSQIVAASGVVVVRDVLYVEDGNRLVLDGETWKSEPCTSMIGRARPVVIFYDQKSTVGIEFEQALEMRGLVTVDPTTTLTELSQAVFRLRKQTTGHSVDFLFVYDSSRPTEAAAYRRFENRETRMAFLTDNEVARALEGRSVWAIANAACLAQTANEDRRLYSREVWVGSDARDRDAGFNINSWLLAPGDTQAANDARARLVTLMSDANAVVARATSTELSVEVSNERLRDVAREMAGRISFAYTATMDAALSPNPTVSGAAAGIADEIVRFVHMRFPHVHVATDALAVLVRLSSGATYRRSVKPAIVPFNVEPSVPGRPAIDPRKERLFALVVRRSDGTTTVHVCTEWDASAALHFIEEREAATTKGTALYSRDGAVIAATPGTAEAPAVFRDPLFWTCCCAGRTKTSRSSSPRWPRTRPSRPASLHSTVRSVSGPGGVCSAPTHSPTHCRPTHSKTMPCPVFRHDFVTRTGAGRAAPVEVWLLLLRVLLFPAVPGPRGGHSDRPHLHSPRAGQRPGSGCRAMEVDIVIDVCKTPQLSRVPKTTERNRFIGA
jgi:hypothetical protein